MRLDKVRRRGNVYRKKDLAKDGGVGSDQTVFIAFV